MCVCVCDLFPMYSFYQQLRAFVALHGEFMFHRRMYHNNLRQGLKKGISSPTNYTNLDN